MDNKKEYKFGQYKERHDGPPGGPMGANAHANDFSGTWKKLIAYCKKYIAVFIVAIFCASIGTVLTLLGPDKLSDMTDTITAGIVPDTAKLEIVSESITGNVSANMETVMGSITAGISDETVMQKRLSLAMMSPDIPDADKAMLQGILSSMNQGAGNSQQQAQLMSLPDSILYVLFPEITVNESVISTADQLVALSLLNSMDKSGEAAMAEAMRELPESVTDALYTDIVIDGVTVSREDQLEVVGLLSGINAENEESALEALDELPESISNLIKPSIDMDKVVRIALTLVIFYALSYVLSAIQGVIMATATQRISKRMRSDISRKINRLPMWYYNRTATGDVLSRVTNDVDTIGQSLNMSIGNLITSVILFFGSLIMMLITNVWMTITAVVSSLLGFVLMFAITGRSQKYFTRQQKHLGELNGHIEEMYAGHTVVKAYNGEDEAQKAFDSMNEKLCESGFKAQCLAGLMQPIMAFIGNFGYVAVCVVGGAMAMKGKIGFGVIVAFMMYVRYFTQPLSQIAQAMQSLQSAAAAGERIFEFLEAEEMREESENSEVTGQITGLVEFDHVRFGYEDSDETVIHDFSAKALPGQKIAIVGPTGAGKTTLVNLLMRFHEIQGGEIRIDGIPTSAMTREQVHSLFCMVLQDTWLFEGTVKENLVYNTAGVSDEKIKEACKAVGLHHFIRTLSKGYDTVLNDQVNLSQGQKQQLTIARAMIADKPMLILDEATSSVDTRTEQQIQNAMDKLMENRTSFVIAHRLSTIKNSDLILVIKDGDIIESGNHEELLEKNGFYAELYNSQFEQTA